MAVTFITLSFQELLFASFRCADPLEMLQQARQITLQTSEFHKGNLIDTLRFTTDLIYTLLTNCKIFSMAASIHTLKRSPSNCCMLHKRLPRSFRVSIRQITYSFDFAFHLCLRFYEVTIKLSPWFI